MQLQKFVGESMPVVLSTLKDALGSDAIILANRRVGDHIEIIATGSLDETSIDNAALFQGADAVAPAVEATIDSIPSDVNLAANEIQNTSSEPSTKAADASSTSNQTALNELDSTHDDSRTALETAPAYEQHQAVQLDTVEAQGAMVSSANSSVRSGVDIATDQDGVSASVVSLGSDENAHSRVDTESESHMGSITTSSQEVSSDEASEAPSQLDVVGTIADAVSSAMEESSQSIAESIATCVNAKVDEQLSQFNTTMNQRVGQLEVNLWGEKDPIKSKHLQTLLEIGLGAELAVTLVNRVDASASFDEALRQSLSDLANTLPVAADRSLTQEGITFVTGPNGAGTTSTLLKLASQKASLSGPDSVVMICADSNRVGVFESLTAHGKSMGVSVVCASTKRELQELLLFYGNKELVLVDQPLQEEFIYLDIPENDVVDFNGRSVRHLLVLPATIQSAVAESTVSEFSKHASARCVITNLDRPCRVGELFTTIIRHNLRVAYWSESADVKMPLNNASAHMLVAAAMAMGKRLVPSEDDRYLMDLIHPRFSATVAPKLRAIL